MSFLRRRLMGAGAVVTPLLTMFKWLHAPDNLSSFYVRRRQVGGDCCTQWRIVYDPINITSILYSHWNKKISWRKLTFMRVTPFFNNCIKKKSTCYFLWIHGSLFITFDKLKDYWSGVSSKNRKLPAVSKNLCFVILRCLLQEDRGFVSD